MLVYQFVWSLRTGGEGNIRSHATPRTIIVAPPTQVFMGLLHHKGVSGPLAIAMLVWATAIPSLITTMTDVWARTDRAVRAQASIVDGYYRQAALTDIQERGQALGLNLQKVLRQDSQYSTHTLDYSTAQKSNELPPIGGEAAAQALCAYLSLGLCWDECLMRTSSF